MKMGKELSDYLNDLKSLEAKLKSYCHSKNDEECEEFDLSKAIAQKASQTTNELINSLEAFMASDLPKENGGFGGKTG